MYGVLLATIFAIPTNPQPPIGSEKIDYAWDQHVTETEYLTNSRGRVWGKRERRRHVRSWYWLLRWNGGKWGEWRLCYTGDYDPQTKPDRWLVDLQAKYGAVELREAEGPSD